MKIPQSLDYKIFSFSRRKFLYFCPETASLFEIDLLTKDILTIENKKGGLDNLYKKYKRKDVLKTLNEIRLLKKKGFLGTNNRITDFRRLCRENKLKRLELHISNTCNLACTYCFAKGGSYGLKICNKNMKWDTARKAIDFLLEQNKDTKEALSVQFFGGEPLLNIYVLKKSLNYIEKKSYTGRYPFIQKSIATNGTLFSEEVIRLLKRYNCIPWISLDASPNSHNKNRPYKNGKPSFNGIMDGIKKIKDLAPNLAVVTCATLGLKDSVDNIIKRQKELRPSHINLKVQFSLYNKKKYTQREFNDLLKRIEAGLNRLSSFYISRGKAFEFLTPYMFYHMHSDRRIYSACGAGIDKLAVNSDGDIFMCSVAMGKRTGLCHISERSIVTKIQDKVRGFYNNYHIRTSECSRCWSRKLCNGPCVLSLEGSSSAPGVNRICDFVRFLNEFYLKSYASMKYKDIINLFGRHKDTEDLLRKIKLLYNVRDLKNSHLEHIKHINPVSSSD